MGLEAIWFFLWGLLWALFFVTDGFDFGVASLFPFLGKSEHDRFIMIRSIGPLWNANEVWLIAAGGVTFAAFPTFYSVMFSALYSPLMIILFSLIVRGASIEFRNQIKNTSWKKVWDISIFISSFIPPLLFGITFANLFKGIPIDQNGIYHGNLFTLINPYGVIGGVFFLCLFIMHGSLWLTFKTSGKLNINSKKIALKIWPLLVTITTIFLATTALFTNLYDNYFKYPLLSLLIFGIIGALLSIKYFLVKELYFKSWLASGLTILGSIFFGVIGLFPNLMKSTIDSNNNLTILNSASSPLTLKIMLIVILIFIPIVLSYQIWTYYIFQDEITNTTLNNTNETY